MRKPAHGIVNRRQTQEMVIGRQPIAIYSQSQIVLASGPDFAASSLCVALFGELAPHLGTHGGRKRARHDSSSVGQQRITVGAGRAYVKSPADGEPPEI